MCLYFCFSVNISMIDLYISTALQNDTVLWDLKHTLEHTHTSLHIYKSHTQHIYINIETFLSVWYVCARVHVSRVRVWCVVCVCACVRVTCACVCVYVCVYTHTHTRKHKYG